MFPPPWLAGSFSWRRLLLAAGVVLLAAGLPAQQPPPPADLPATVLRVTTRLVLVDVVVTDKDGKPLPGLTKDDFQVFEDSQPQRIATFSFESPAARPVVEPPPLPADVYTNRPEYRMPPGPLTILLIDGMNTPNTQQAFVRDQMLRYVGTQLKPNQRTAILGLTNSLYVLQDFTTDPRLLVETIKKLQTGTSVALAREQPDAPLPAEGAALMASFGRGTLDTINRFATERAAVATDVRVQTTLGALRAIARATAGYRGRKNLVWVSSAFPFNVVPENAEDFDLYRSYADDMRRTAAILSDAQVAVYPVDARGLVGFTAADAADPGRNQLGRGIAGSDFGSTVSRSMDVVASSHAAMNSIASDTGGRAYYNRNDIDAAVDLSIADGSTYYSLGYYPQRKDWDGKFRQLEVKVAREDVKVRYRRGYYAFDPAEPPKFKKVKDETEAEGKIKDQELLAALSDPLPATVVTFLTHVPPPAPGAPVTVEFLVDTKTVTFEELPDGRRQFSLDFLVAAFSPEGKVANHLNHTVGAALPPDRYAQFQQRGLPYRMQLPLEPGRYQLRLIVRDNRTGLLGTTDVPVVLNQP